MNKRNAQETWVEIDTNTSDDTGDKDFELNLSKDLDEEDTSEFKKENSKDTRRGILTVSETKAKETKKDNKTRTESEEDQEEGASRQESSRETEVEEQEPRREGRAHKRIKTLIGRLNEKDRYIQELESKFRQVATRGKQAEKQSVQVQAAQWKEIIEAKKQALEEAANKSDGKEIARLSQEIADATMKYNAFEAVQEDFEDEPEEPKVQQPPEVPEAAKDWLKRNTWFKTDPKKHVIARMISAELTNEGELDPHDDEFWEELDERMKKTVKMQDSDEETKEKPKKKGSPVGSRSDEDSENRVQTDKQFSRIGNKVQANPSSSDLDMAERLNVNIKDYMKEKYKYAQQDYKGYVTIDVPGQ